MYKHHIYIYGDNIINLENENKMIGKICYLQNAI